MSRLTLVSPNGPKCNVILVVTGILSSGPSQHISWMATTRYARSQAATPPDSFQADHELVRQSELEAKCSTVIAQFLRVDPFWAWLRSCKFRTIPCVSKANPFIKEVCSSCCYSWDHSSFGIKNECICSSGYDSWLQETYYDKNMWHFGLICRW